MPVLVLIDRIHLTPGTAPHTSRDGLPAVEEVKDVAGLLVVDLEDGPERLHLTFALVWLRLSCGEIVRASSGGRYQARDANVTPLCDRRWSMP